MTRFFSKAQAAQYLKVAPRTIQRYMAQGKIRVLYRRTKRGREAVFRERDLYNFLAEQREGVTVRKKSSPASKREQRKQLELLQRIANSLEKIVLANKLALTREEAAELAGFPLSWIKDGIRLGKLKTTTTGRGVRIARVDLEEFISKVSELPRGYRYR